jgi:transposase
VSMTSSGLKSGVLNGPERRRRRTPGEKLAIVAETQEPGVTVSLVARRHAIAPNQLFLWRRLASQGALTATQSEEPVVPASEYRSLLGRVRDLQRLLGKKTMEAEILKEALEFSAGSKKHLLRSLWWPKDGSR